MKKDQSGANCAFLPAQTASWGSISSRRACKHCERSSFVSRDCCRDGWKHFVLVVVFGVLLFLMISISIIRGRIRIRGGGVGASVSSLLLLQLRRVVVLRSLFLRPFFFFSFFFFFFDEIVVVLPFVVVIVFIFVRKILRFERLQKLVLSLLLLLLLLSCCCCSREMFFSRVSRIAPKTTEASLSLSLSSGDLRPPHSCLESCLGVISLGFIIVTGFATGHANWNHSLSLKSLRKTAGCSASKLFSSFLLSSWPLLRRKSATRADDFARPRVCSIVFLSLLFFFSFFFFVFGDASKSTRELYHALLRPCDAFGSCVP